MRTGRFLRGKPISDHGLFLPARANKERRLGTFLRMHRALGSWMLACAPASPAQGLHHHGPRYYDYFFMTSGLEKLGLVDQNR